MTKYLFLKHYRGAPPAADPTPMDRWTPQEVTNHIEFMNEFADRLKASGEFVDARALHPEGTFVRYDGPGRPPVTDDAALAAKDLIAGWMIIDVATYDRALDLASELSSAPGHRGEPLHEWLELRPLLED